MFRATPQLPAFISAPDVTAGLGKPARGKSTGDDSGASTFPFSAAPAISGDPGGGRRDRVAPLPVRGRNPRIEGLGMGISMVSLAPYGQVLPWRSREGGLPVEQTLVGWGEWFEWFPPACVCASRGLALARWVLGRACGTASPAGAHGTWPRSGRPLSCHRRCFRGLSTARSLDPQERMDALPNGEAYRTCSESGEDAVCTNIHQMEPACARLDAYEVNLQAGRIMCGRVHRVRGLTPLIYRIRRSCLPSGSKSEPRRTSTASPRAAHG